MSAGLIFPCNIKTVLVLCIFIYLSVYFDDFEGVNIAGKKYSSNIIEAKVHYRSFIDLRRLL